MSSYYFLEIPLFSMSIMIWIFCCYYMKYRRERVEEPLVCREPPSVYVIPLYHEEQEDSMYDCYGVSYAESEFCDRELDLPPPYRLEPPSYFDAVPPSYSDVFRDSTGQTVT